MSNVFFTTGNKPRAVVSIRRAATGQPQSLNDAIPDGDTAGIHLQGSVPVRFLGVDSPEKSIDLAVTQGGNNSTHPSGRAILPIHLTPNLGHSSSKRTCSST
jgi:hypothetical protein